MNMSLRADYRRRVLGNSLVIATTLLSCTALRADHEDQDKSAAQGASGQYEKGEKQGNKAQKFINETVQSGQMEVRMGQLGQQKAQNPEVKSLAAVLVRDHTQANQKLQQLAQQKGIQLDPGTDQKHQQHLDKLQSLSGAEFDKAFVQHAIKDHKKAIGKFEKSQKDVQDAELKAFIDETLPTLRNHLEMAQNVARSIGVDVNVAADIEEDTESAVGAPATGVTGTRDDNPSKGGNLNSNGSDQSSLNSNSSSATSSTTIETSPSTDKPQSTTSPELYTTVRRDSSLIVNQNNPSAKIEGNVGDQEFKADASLSTTDTSIKTDVSTDSSDNKVFQEGDGKILGINTEKNDNKVLGLSTDKHDGKYLGIIPKPKGNSSSSSTVVTTTDTSSGGPAVSTSGSARSSERINLNAAPTVVQQVFQSEGITSGSNVRRMTIYEAEANGKRIHVTEDGRVYKMDSNVRLQPIK